MQVHEHEAVARGENLPISRKHAKEVADFIKGDSVEKARGKLERVIDEELAVPYSRHNKNLAHESGDMDAGRYPVKTAEEMLELLNSAESNAVHEGLSEENLSVVNIIVNQGNRYQTPKRHRGRKPKSAHVSIKVGEQ